MTYEELKKDPEIRLYLTRADDVLLSLGYTEHNFPHACLVAERAGEILTALHFDPHTVELGKIAGYLHDVGNLVNRIEHSQSGAVMCFFLLQRLGFSPEDIATVTSAVGNHDEGTGIPVNEVAAALILADKSDVRRSRVRTEKKEEFDIHDRVNFSVSSSHLVIVPEKNLVTLSLQVDSSFASVMEYFEIFMERMLLCRKAAETLGLEFALLFNGQKMV